MCVCVCVCVSVYVYILHTTVFEDEKFCLVKGYPGTP